MLIPREWSFMRKDIAEGFDRHVREQLPWYEIMSGAVAHVARHYIPQGGRVYDIGCSTGNIGNLLRQTIETRDVDFQPIDNSQQMVEKYTGPGKVLIADVSGVEFEPFDVAVCFLCLMFLSPEKRSGVFERLRGAMRQGGAIVIVDKMESEGGYIGTVMSRLTLAGKIAAGVGAEEVIEKELSLIGVQRPLKRQEIGDAVEIFRFGEFAGFIIEADKCEGK